MSILRKIPKKNLSGASFPNYKRKWGEGRMESACTYSFRFKRLVEIFTETDEKPQKDDEYRGAVAAGAAMFCLSQPLSKTS